MLQRERGISKEQRKITREIKPFVVHFYGFRLQDTTMKNDQKATSKT